MIAPETPAYTPSSARLKLGHITPSSNTVLDDAEHIGQFTPDAI